MALLFRTELGGGSSIEPYTVIVSLDENFEGQPVTLTQGTEIMRKTCPMTAPYEVEFKPMNDGVWVASSTTKDGKVVSVDTEPLLEWGTYNVTLESGFNFQEWLNRGRVEKTFTSLDDVLADQPTVRQLMTVHDSIDYLVTALSNDANTAEKILDNDICAKWINLRDYALDMLYANANVKAVMDSVDKYGYGEWALIGQVPKMTSNTAPSGEVFGGNSSSSSNLWKAFNQNPSDTAAGFSNINEYWIGYDFTKDVKINSVTIRGWVDGGKDSIKDFNIECSSDKINWEIVYSGQHTEVLGYETFTFDNDKSRRYWRIKCTSGTWAGSNTGGISVLQFYAWGAKGAVPVMTSNTAPYGEVIHSNVGGYTGNWNDNLAYYIFDNVNSIGAYTENANFEIGYKFVNPISVRRIDITGNSSGKDYAGKIMAYINNAWVELCELTFSNGIEGKKEIKLDTPTAYTTEIKFVSTIPKTPSTGFSMKKFQIYGRTLNVSIPTMTSNTEPWGVVTATDYYKDGSVTYDPWRAFSNATDRGWLPANFNDELVYDFGYPVLVKKMTLRNAKQASTWTSKVYYDLFGSIDGQKYDLIQNDVNCYTHKNDLFTYSINTNKYRFYKLVCTKNDNGRATSGYGCILQLYGLDYSEREFAEGSTMKYLYDHGVELQNIKIVASSSQAEKLPYCLYQHSPTKTDVGFISPLLDMINYKLMRTVFGDTVTTNSYMSVCDTPTGSATAYKYTNIDLPYNHYLDISNIRYNGYARIGIENTGNAVKVTEWWLE